jgi:hypothetical protein
MSIITVSLDKVEINSYLTNIKYGIFGITPSISFN